MTITFTSAKVQGIKRGRVKISFLEETDEAGQTRFRGAKPWDIANVAAKYIFKVDVEVNSLSLGQFKFISGSPNTCSAANARSISEKVFQLT